MSLDKDTGPAGSKFNRRNIIMGAAAAAGAAALAAGEWQIGSDTMDAYRKSEAERLEREKPFTHKGTALVMNKIEKGGSGSLTEAELLNGAISGYSLGGSGGMLMNLSNLASVESMDQGHFYYLLLKIDDRNLVLERVTPLMYRTTERAASLEAEYVVDENDPQKVLKIKKLDSRK